MTRSRHSGHEGGSITPFVVLLVLALAAVIALVGEGGELLSARQEAVAEAEQAARAGAAVVSAQSLRSGAIMGSGQAASEEAEHVMAEAGHPGSAYASGTTVTARVTPFKVATPLLAIVGISWLRVSAAATAQAVAG